MKIETLLKELKDNNVSLSLRNGKLLCKLPEAGINDDLFNLLKDRKEEITEIIQQKINLKKYKPIAIVPEMENYPLSPAQKRLWILSQLEGGSQAYNIPFAGKFTGDIQPTLFEQAFQQLIEKHEILRTAFKTDEQTAEVRQFILPNNTVDFNIEHLDFSTEKEVHQKVEDYLNAICKESIDLEVAPLFRASLIKTAAQEHALLFVIHHTICDGWSMELFISEIVSTYNRLQQGQISSLTPLRIQYKDYVAWLEGEMAKEKYQKSEQYWLHKFAGELPVLNLPTSKRRPPNQTFNGSSLTQVFSADFTNTLKSFSEKNNITLFTTIMAGVKSLLSRYTGQHDIIVGTPVAARVHPDLENQIGLYVNTLAIRTQLEAANTFHDLLKLEQQNLLEANEHQIYSFETLVDNLKLNRDLSRSALFDVFVIFQNQAKLNLRNDDGKIKGLAFEPYYFQKKTAQFDISFYFSENEDQLELELEYNTDIYDEIFIRKIFNHFENLLLRAVADKETPLNSIDYMTEEERSKVLSFSNSAKVAYPKGKTVIELFEAQVELNPLAEAVRHQEASWSYQEVSERAINYAALLQNEYKITSGDRVVVSLDYGVHLIPVLLAIKKLGAIYVSLDPTTPADRIAYVVKDSQSKLTINNDFIETLEEAQKNDQLTLSPLTNEANTEDVEFIIYTSGSTGNPKGIMIKSDGVMNRLNWMWNNYPYTDQEVACAKTSISFVDHICEIYGPLLKGIPLVLFDKEAVLQVEKFIKKLHQHKVTRIVLVPSLLRKMLLFPDLCKQQLQQLKIWISSGEPLKKVDVENFYATIQNSTVRLLNIYGSTEVTADATFYDTYEAFNQYKDFKLFNTSAKDEIEGLIETYNFSKKIIDQPLSEMVSDEYFKNTSTEGQFSMEEYMSFLESKVLPNVVNVSHPSFIGHMTGPVPDIVKQLNSLVVALNQNQVKIETSSVATLIEKQLVGIFHNLVYSESTDFYQQYVQDADHALGVVTNGGTMSNLVALSYTLNKHLKPKPGFMGLAKEGLLQSLKAYGYEKVALLGSTWCHYSFDKALKLLGLGSNAFVQLDLEDKTEEEISEELTSVIGQLKKEKTLILGMVGIAGTTESGNIEPLEILGKIAEQHQIHFHVDAAFGGSFLTDDILRNKLKGIELADSATICAHKQLYVPIGLSVCVFKDPSHAKYSESNSRYQARKGSYDLGRFTLEGSKSFMSLVLHGAFHILGKEGFAQVIRNNYKSAQTFAKMIEEQEAFELLYKPDLNIVLYRFIPLMFRGKNAYTNAELETINDLNTRIQKEQFKRGNSFVSYTSVKRKGNETSHIVFRTVFMNPYTTVNHLAALLEEQKSIAFELEHGAKRKTSKRFNENISIGRPIENVKVYILDEHLNMLPVGLIGEICISGDCVAAGYVGAEELNQNQFIENHFSSGERLYKTGDLGRWKEDGNIEFVGRKDNQIKIRGNRIELGEIENILLNKKGIAEVVVTAIDAEEVGEKELAAYFTSNKEEKITDLVTTLRKSLPDYMLPAYFVQLEKFPLTVSGKINKKVLPDPKEVGMSNKAEYVAPKNMTEEQLVSIWQEVLERKNIGIKDDFFTLGGHSIKATKVMLGISKVFDLELSVAEVLSNNTIEYLALLIDEKQWLRNDQQLSNELLI